MKQIAIGFILGIGTQFIVGAYANSQTDREIDRVRSELSASNQQLKNIARSLDRIDDAFGNTGYIRVRLEK